MALPHRALSKNKKGKSKMKRITNSLPFKNQRIY
jgi:hypothetical protein